MTAAGKGVEPNEKKYLLNRIFQKVPDERTE